MSETVAEELIESAPRPPPAWRRRAEAALRQPAGAAALLVLGLLVGSIAGYVVGQGNPRSLAGLGYFVGWYTFEPEPPRLEPFEQTYGRALPPSLAPEDLAAIGESVTSRFSVLSARSAIPVMCGASIGQPGSAPNYLDLSYPATVFRVDGGEITELVWPHPDEVAASGVLHTLAFQAQLCPELPNFQTRVVTSGVQTGIGDEYVVFSQQPTVAGDPGAFFTSVALVRVGADLIEIAFTADGVAVPDAEARCLSVAEAAVRRALEG